MAAAGDGKNPAAVNGSNDDGKNPAFRWINAARCTVALVVTVLIVSVIVNAIKFVTRPDQLHVSVVGGFVSTVKLLPPPKAMLALDLNVRAQNPSGRARMYYTNITAYFFDSNTSASTSNAIYYSMVYGKIPAAKDMVVPLQASLDSSMRVKATKGSMPVYFDSLYSGGRPMRDVTLRLDGNLTTEIYGPDKTLPTTYYCEKLLLGGDKDDEAFKGLPDVICTLQP